MRSRVDHLAVEIVRFQLRPLARHTSLAAIVGQEQNRANAGHCQFLRHNYMELYLCWKKLLEMLD